MEAIVSSVLASLGGKAAIGAVSGIAVVCLIATLGFCSDIAISAVTAAVGDFFTVSVNLMSIPAIAQAIRWAQGIAIAAVIAVRVAVGVKSIILDGSSDDISLTEYVFKSVSSVVLVAIMPSLCAGVIQVGGTMLSDVMYGTSAAGLYTQAMGDYSMLESCYYGMEAYADGSSADAAAAGSVGRAIITGLMLLACSCMLLVCMGQFIVRQVEMCIVAMAAPWVSVLCATRDDAPQYWDVLKNLFGMCVCQWIEYLLILVGLQFLANARLVDSSTLLTTQGMATLAFAAAVFFAAIGTSRLINRYTFSSGMSGSSGMVLGMLLRKVAR